MPKILVKKPVVDINGDEMARVIWAKIKKELILPFLDISLLGFDLKISNRDITNDDVTIQAANAIKKNNIGVKCATITPDDNRVNEYNLKKKYPSPNGTIRKILNGTIFREPIIVKRIPRIVGHWNKSVVIARHAFGDIYQAKEIEVTKKGKITLNYKNAKETVSEVIHEFDSPGVGLAYFNLDNSIRDFANACFNFAIKQKNTSIFIYKKYNLTKV